MSHLDAAVCATELLNDLELVVWDWNGTLHDDAEICRELTNAQLLRLGLEALSIESHQILFQHPVSEYYRRMGANLSREEFEALSEEFHSDFEVKRKEGGLRPFALEALQYFKQRAVPQIILSAYREKDLKEMLIEVGIQDFFLDILGPADCHAIEKVTRAQSWFHEHSYSPQKTLLIGDTNHDFEVAEAIGTRCLLIPGGYQHINLLRQTGAPILTSLRSLVEAL